MIIDEVKIYLRAGSGGTGEVSSMKLSARRVVGGGGDGGNGGDVIFRVSPHCSDLIKFNDHKRFIAPDGEHGKEYNKKGKFGENLIINVPAGTMILDLEGNLIVDLINDGQEYLACRGGEGGKGNYKKLYSLPAHPGEEKEVVLYYSIPNDVAIVGFPNSGKTALFNKLTGKSYKVAEYPFTTTSCVWAPVAIDYQRFTVLDTPPLRQHVSDIHTQGRFLRHLFRSKIILILSDSVSSYREEFAMLKKMLASFDERLLEDKKLFYLLTKIDTIDKKEKLERGVVAISIENHVVLEALKKKIMNYINKSHTGSF
ncbi:MAG: GTPase [Candidatus Omnitrophota bacterium]